MSPTLKYTVFYAVCATIVVWMFYRMWRKNRNVAPANRVPARAQSRVPAPATLVQAATAIPALPTVPSPIPHSPVMVRTATEATTAVASVATVSPTRDIDPTANIPTYHRPASSILKDQVEPDPSSWEGRRLLESTGILPRDTNLMPRILPADIPGVDDSDRAFGSLLNPAFAALLPESEERKEEARKDLTAAGYYNPHAVENLAATRYVLMMLSVILFGALVLIVPPQLEPWMMACCLLTPLLGWSLPALYVRGKAKQRKQEIERAMPDLLDMLNMCVGQGLTVPASLQRMGRDFRAVYPALSQELNIVNEQSRIGTMQTALENFSRRIDSPEVHSLTSLLIQTERMGTSISQALTTYSDTMRESQRQQADEKGNRATFRLLFPTVLCLMPAVYLFLLGPAVNELQKFFYGGGLQSLNNGSQVVQRVNSNRNRVRNPASPNRPARQ